MNLKIFPATITSDNKKIPLIEGWQEKATNDPNQIRQWQEFFGARLNLWGAPTGIINDIFVLDIDNKPDGVNGFESLRNLGINELPNTAWQSTPSNGLHLIFKNNPSLSLGNTVNKELGLDTRCNGGWIGLYGIKNTENFIPIPQWIDLVIKKQNKKEKQNANTDAVVKLDPSISIDAFNNSISAIKNAGQGERNHTLNTHSYVVGKLVAGGALSREYAYEELKKAAVHIGLDPREAHATIMSGLGSGTQNPMTHPFANAPAAPAIFIPEVKVPEPRPRWTPKFGTYAMLTDWTKLKKPQLFEHWSTEDITLTSAVGGVGKTTLKLFESVCLALGQPFLGFKNVTRGRTLFIIGEDSEDKLYATLGKMCKDLGLFEPTREEELRTVLNNVVFKRANDICLVMQDPRTRTFVPNLESLEKIKEAIDDLQPKQIIFDPIAMFWGSESGGNDMAMALSKAMQELQIYSNASVDMITHIGKDSYTRKDLSQFSGRGGTALANHSRVVRTLLKLNETEYKEETGLDLKEGETAILCNVSKFSDGSPILDKPFVILRTGYLFERIECIEKGDAEKSNDVTREKDLIYQWLKANSTDNRPVTQKDLVDVMVLSGIKKTVTKSVVTILKLDRLIEEVPHVDSLVGEWLRVK